MTPTRAALSTIATLIGVPIMFIAGMWIVSRPGFLKVVIYTVIAVVLLIVVATISYWVRELYRWFLHDCKSE